MGDGYKLIGGWQKQNTIGIPEYHRNKPVT